MHETLKIKKVIALLCFLFISLALLKNYELGYSYLGFDYQMQKSSNLLSKNNIILFVYLLLIIVLTFKKSFYYLIIISPLITLITYFELDYNYYYLNISFLFLYIIFNVLIININLKYKLYIYILILIINMVIISNFLLIDRKNLISEKFKFIFSGNYRKIKSDNQITIENICNNVKLNKYSRNRANNCTYNYEGTFSGSIPNKFNPIYNENGIFNGYTDIIFNYERSSTRYIINNTFYLKSDVPIKKAIIDKNKCYIPAENFIYSILNDQLECDDTTHLNKIVGQDNLYGRVFYNLKSDERYDYYGTYVNGDQFKGVITLPIKKNEKFQIITGPSSDNLYIELYSKNNSLLYRENLKIYNSWTEVSINNLLNLNDLSYLKLIDEGDMWGQWLGIRVIK